MRGMRFKLFVIVAHLVELDKVPNFCEKAQLKFKSWASEASFKSSIEQKFCVFCLLLPLFFRNFFAFPFVRRTLSS